MTTNEIELFTDPATIPPRLRADMEMIRNRGENGWTLENAVHNACFVVPDGRPGSSQHRDALDLIQASAHLVLEMVCEDCGVNHLDPRDSHAASAGLCSDCMSFCEWENTHSDEGHDEDNVDPDCPVCKVCDECGFAVGDALVSHRHGSACSLNPTNVAAA